ncbi:MAG TPA: hypothetical protein VFK31_08020 [Rhodanobacteraceae bacterium]|nr:hypothetical protein [Rhodanobacteraceae bacterium]
MGDAMPDIVVRHIDDAMAERIKTLARERQWSINDVILHGLRYGLGMGGDAFASHENDFRSVANLSGTWDASETAAFQEALDALASAEPERMKNDGD